MPLRSPHPAQHILLTLKPIIPSTWASCSSSSVRSPPLLSASILFSRPGDPIIKYPWHPFFIPCLIQTLPKSCLTRIKASPGLSLNIILPCAARVSLLRYISDHAILLLKTFNSSPPPMGWRPSSFNLAHRPCILWTLLPFSFIPHPLPYPYNSPLWKPFMIYWAPIFFSWAFLVAQMIKNLPAMWETWVQSLGWEDPLEKGIAIHSSILAWRIPWTEEPGGL